jgi:hypothetical protein
VRDRLAKLILDALHDADARDRLGRLAAGSGRGRAPRTELTEGAPDTPGSVACLFADLQWERHADQVGERARRAWEALGKRQLYPRDAPLSLVLDAAAILFDAGLYFEVHELLEPHWARAGPVAREALQGLIQVAVGLQHLANGNRAGARALLRAGRAKLLGRKLCGLDLDAFAHQIRDGLQAVERPTGGFGWAQVPHFPTAVPGTAERGGGAHLQ